MIKNLSYLKIAKGLSHHLEYLKEQDVYGLVSPETHFNPAQIAPIPSVGLTLEKIREDIGDCKRCKLSEKRKSIVFGEGCSTPEIVFIGEGPGRDEDQQGRPFVGRAGQLLDKIILAMGLRRNEVYITNIVKCRPPENRTPEQDEIASCAPFLKKQIETLNPRVICALGAVAAQFLTNRPSPIGVLRGKFYDYQSICLRATYHPAALLRNPALKRHVWEDVKTIMSYVGRPVPSSGTDT